MLGHLPPGVSVIAKNERLKILSKPRPKAEDEFLVAFINWSRLSLLYFIWR